MGGKLAKGSHVNGEGEFRNQYRLGRKLGEGAFGVVHECRKRDVKNDGTSGEDGEAKYAVKMIDRVEADTSDITREIEVMVNLDHPNIVGFVAVFQEKCFVCIVMQKFNGGDLVDGLQLHLKNKGKIPEHIGSRLCLQIFAATEHCHAKGYIHRDIKGDNVLMDRVDLSDPNCHLVITDFGTAIAHQPNKILRQFTGTRVFWSPEMCQRRYSFPADTWACGVVMYGLVDATFPFRDERQICEKEPRMPGYATPQCKDLLTKMLCKDPEKRIKIQDALKHPWITAHAPATPVAPPAAAKEEAEEQASSDSVVGREQVPQAMALRRKEMAQVYNKKEGVKKFEIVDFKAEGLHAGEMIHYKWFDAKDAASLYEVSGADQTGNKGAKRFVWTPKTLEEHLQKNQIKTAKFGTGKAKTLAELCAEITEGECSLMHDCTGGFSSSKIVRVVELVLLRIRAQGQNGTTCTLIEAKEKLSDGREYETWRLPGAKQRPNESVKATAERIVGERLHIDIRNIGFKWQEKEIAEVKEDSPSYPGVVTVYRKHIIEGAIQMQTLKPSEVAAIGGVKMEAFMTKGAKNEMKTWQWLAPKDISKKKIKTEGKKATDEVSSLVASNLKIDDEGLKVLLEDGKIDVTKFGGNGAKTIFEVAQEIARGECHLQVSGPGVVARVVDVVLLRISDAASGKILLETARTNERTGGKKAKDQLPGAKSRPAESIYATAKRITNCLLHIPEDKLHFGSHSLFEQEVPKDARYPGLSTVYRKHVIHVTADAASA
ncbi:unnamed protein product [Amoebophrya sp. A25]|nr:unnamed protein product [Amoebophrya sp. A25]|eukprot:GSA25T00012040001.1